MIKLQQCKDSTVVCMESMRNRHLSSSIAKLGRVNRQQGNQTTPPQRACINICSDFKTYLFPLLCFCLSFLSHQVATCCTQVLTIYLAVYKREQERHGDNSCISCFIKTVHPFSHCSYLCRHLKKTTTTFVGTTSSSKQVLLQRASFSTLPCFFFLPQDHRPLSC